MASKSASSIGIPSGREFGALLVPLSIIMRVIVPVVVWGLRFLRLGDVRRLSREVRAVPVFDLLLRGLRDLDRLRDVGGLDDGGALDHRQIAGGADQPAELPEAER